MSDATARQKAEDSYYAALDLMADGHLEKAVAAYQESLAADPAFTDAMHGLTRALQDLGLEGSIRLAIPHFMVLPRIIAETDLAVIMPARLSDAFAKMGRIMVWRPNVGPAAFDVAVHWVRRFEGDPANRWLRELIASLFGES